MRSQVLGMVPGGSRARGLLAGLVMIVPATACENLPLAMGDFNSIITTAAPALWGEVGGDLVPVLERTVFTVRDEKIFTVTPAEPGTDSWFKLRMLKQQLVIGTAADPWMAPVLDKVGEPVAAPRIAHVEDVWARGQVVTAVVLEEGSEAEGLRELTPALGDTYVDWFRDRSVARMFVTDPDTVMSRELAEKHGFSLIVPAVYRYEATDSVHVFRNDNPDPSELIRQFAITWQSPIEPDFGTEELLAWRARTVDGYYNYPQVVNSRTSDRRAGDSERSGGLHLSGGVGESAGRVSGGGTLDRARDRLSEPGAQVPCRRVALRAGTRQVRVHGPARRDHELVPLHGILRDPA